MLFDYRKQENPQEELSSSATATASEAEMEMAKLQTTLHLESEPKTPSQVQKIVSQKKVYKKIKLRKKKQT